MKVQLWFDAEQRACNADIDTLVIEPGGATHYELAVNMVVNTLKNDVSRPAYYLQRVPVIIRGCLKLSPATERLLRDTFKSVRREG